jgi:hAT family C-terminal dimerisation region
VAGVWTDAEDRRIRFQANAAKLPRTRRLPQRFDGADDSAEYDSPKKFYRVQYFCVLDKIITTIDKRFNSPAWKLMNSMERLLVSSIRGDEIQQGDIEAVLQHSEGELSTQLVGELAQLKHIIRTDDERRMISSFAMVLAVLRKERPLLRLLPQVVALTKLLCVLPCSTATAERSFSQLKLIKSYMRSTMDQPRLNHLMVLAVHREKLSSLDIDRVMAEFIMRNDHRRQMFMLPKII